MAVLIEAKTEGLANLLKNLDALADATTKAAASAVAQVSVDVANHAKDNHTFTNRTGNLENSIQPEAVEVDGTALVGVVRAGMEYAANVEYGTAKSAPYPFMTPAVEANKQNLSDTIKAAIERAQREVRNAGEHVKTSRIAGSNVSTRPGGGT